jgi:proteic killer suppression protein
VQGNRKDFQPEVFPEAAARNPGRGLRKLRMVHRSISLDDLRIPPANRLEALRGDRKGSWSIRVNDQYRVCFVWKDGHAFDVEIVDYH